jgi:hypothetical protein
MNAGKLVITEKLREVGDPRTVRPSDFRLRDEGAIEPRTVLQNPNLTLYCLDLESREALFLETPPDCDLTRAPFLYKAQYESALRAVSVPFTLLERLAEEVVIDPARLILIYSTGRCGSTLVSRAYAEVAHVESLSEPDVFTQVLGVWGCDGLNGKEKTDLVRNCTLLQCAPGKAKGANAWAFKFRSMVTTMWPLFYGAFPEARVVFLYRGVESWARSFHRMMGSPDPSEPAPMAMLRYLFGRLPPRLEPRETASALEIMVNIWLPVMEACLAMKQAGLPVFIVRYEELNARPLEVLARMFAHAGLDSDAVGHLGAVLAQDSQAGTPLSRDSLAEGKSAFRVTAEHLIALRRLISEGSDALSADTILPDTYFPESAGSVA